MKFPDFSRQETSTANLPTQASLAGASLLAQESRLTALATEHSSLPRHDDAEPSELVTQLLEIGIALSSSRNLEEILRLILQTSCEITCSDAGSVYLIDRRGPEPSLIFKVAQNTSRPNVSWEEFTVPITQNSLAGYVALTGESLNLPDAYHLPPGVPYKLNPEFDQAIPYKTRSVLVLPMQNQEKEIIGVLQLINRKISPDLIVGPDNVHQVTIPYSKWEEKVIRILACQAAVSIERSQLQESIEQLFEGFVTASVRVIEARDPTTSGHSERVAALTVRLAEETHAIASGPLREFTFDDRQIQEIRYAALLHDFGKVGVPEAVLVKAKKLYPDQFEIVRQRFALARRALELECAQNKFRYLLEHPHPAHAGEDAGCRHCQAQAEFDRKLIVALEKLDHYWQRVVEINEPQILESQGFQILTEEALAELSELARYTYRDIDGTLKPLLTPAELEQLLVPRGNLTVQERLAIEKHAEHTYHFLIQIPWTKHLDQVPDIARGHHKKLDGSGYPYDLELPKIPIQTQMLTIADIYDALTAADRPYKRRLSVTAALQILHQEADKQKLNADLLQLFEHRQVFTVVGHHREDD
ncbi:HD-GYP domain-containing protein [Trichothermofontia sp.]